MPEEIVTADVSDGRNRRPIRRCVDCGREAPVDHEGRCLRSCTSLTFLIRYSTGADPHPEKTRLIRCPACLQFLGDESAENLTQSGASVPDHLWSPNHSIEDFLPRTYGDEQAPEAPRQAVLAPDGGEPRA